MDLAWKPPADWERWPEEWNEDLRALWCDRWQPNWCPVGNQQIRGRPLGFSKQTACELELRVALRRDEGVCQVIVDELGDEVYVLVITCYEEEEPEHELPAPLGERLDCPVRVWLDRPLGDRAVINVDTDKELDLYTPAYGNGMRQHDHGYRPANRRRSKAS
jgi:hypothetical protein